MTPQFCNGSLKKYRVKSAVMNYSECPFFKMSPAVVMPPCNIANPIKNTGRINSLQYMPGYVHAFCNFKCLLGLKASRFEVFIKYDLILVMQNH